MKLLTKFLAHFKKDTLSKLLKDRSLREQFLSVDRPRSLSEDKQESDASKLINYSRSEDYKVYAEELWQTVIMYVKDLTKEDLKTEEMHFIRGCLSATLDDLRISYKAFQYLESLREKPPVLNNGIRRESPTPGRN